MEMMTAMGYDAMGVGNHEFDYGWEAFERRDHARALPRRSAATSATRRTALRFCRPCTVLERNGVRLGVIGVMGRRAAHYTIMPSKVAALEFTDPVGRDRRLRRRSCGRRSTSSSCSPTRGCPDRCRPTPRTTRPCSGRSTRTSRSARRCPASTSTSRRTRTTASSTPLVHPDTGTLARPDLRLRHAPRAHSSSRSATAGCRAPRRAAQGLERRAAGASRRSRRAWRTTGEVVAGQIGRRLGRATGALRAQVPRESPLGALRHRRHAGAGAGARSPSPTPAACAPTCPPASSIAATCSTRCRSSTTVVAVELSGRSPARRSSNRASRSTAGHGAGLGRCARVYDLARPVGGRGRRSARGRHAGQRERTYRVATNSFLAEGGDRYEAFRNGRVIGRDAVLSTVIAEHIQAIGTVQVPAPGRLVPAGTTPA